VPRDASTPPIKGETMPKHGGARASSGRKTDAEMMRSVRLQSTTTATAMRVLAVPSMRTRFK